MACQASDPSARKSALSRRGLSRGGFAYDTHVGGLGLDRVGGRAAHTVSHLTRRGTGIRPIRGGWMTCAWQGDVRTAPSEFWRPHEPGSAGP